MVEPRCYSGHLHLHGFGLNHINLEDHAIDFLVGPSLMVVLRKSLFAGQPDGGFALICSLDPYAQRSLDIEILNLGVSIANAIRFFNPSHER